MKFSTELEAGLVTAVEALISEYVGQIETSSLSELEQEVQELLHGVGRCVLSALLEKMDGKYPADTVRCGCGGQARYVEKREGTSITLQGKVRYRRAYYVCACGCGQCPLDWFHASSYLATIANDAFGDGSPDAIAWFDHHKTLLHDGHWRALIRACRAIRPNAPTAVDAARCYFANHRSRLRYPKFLTLDLQIGSGVMESACKQLGLQRLKLSGARWSTEGARKLVKARAAFLSDKRNFYPFALPQVA